MADYRGPCGKWLYQSKREAKEAAVRAVKTSGDGAPRFVYRCRTCRAFHVTRQDSYIRSKGDRIQRAPTNGGGG